MDDDGSSSFIIPLVSFNNSAFVRGLCNQLGNQGHNSIILPKNKYVHEEALRIFPSNEVLKPVNDYTPNKPLGDLIEKYDIKSSRNLVFPDMVYDYDYPSPNHSFYFPNRDIPYDQYTTRLHKWLDRLDSLYSKEGYIPIQNQGGEIFRQCLQIVAEHHDHPVIWRGFSPKSGMCSLHSNDKLSWKIFDNIAYNELSSRERSDARELIENVTGEREQIGSSSKGLRNRIEQKLQAIRTYRGSLIDPTISWLRESLISDIKLKYFNHIYLDEQESREFINQNKFIYYPIQYFRESRVTYRSNAYYNQMWLIEYLARSLPHGYELVVKDHPHRAGELPLTYPRKMSQSACMVAHTLNSREIIEEADAVVTLNNTVGFESLMFGQSVIALGSGFYADSEYVHQIGDINEIKSDLYEAVHSDGLSEEEVIEVAAGIIGGSYPGVWGDQSEANVERFANSVLEFLNGTEG